MRLINLAKRYAAQVQRGRDWYARSDETLQALLLQTGGPATLDLKDGTQLVIKDRFADGKLKAFHATACNRYEVKIEPNREATGTAQAGEA